jgi:hypothetical protein
LTRNEEHLQLTPAKRKGKLEVNMFNYITNHSYVYHLIF